MSSMSVRTTKAHGLPSVGNGRRTCPGRRLIPTLISHGWLSHGWLSVGFRAPAVSVCILAALAVAAPVRGDFITERWGNGPTCRHRGTVSYADRVIKFDLSALPRGAEVHRAVFKPAVKRRGYNGTVQFCPIVGPVRGDEPPIGKPLALRAPLFGDFDATEIVRKWAANPRRNLGLYAKWAPGVRAEGIVLEITYAGRAAVDIAAVTGLTALHQAGQTFLTWKEIEDPVGSDTPKFEDFHNAVLAARKKRSIVYRVYRSDRPITVDSIGRAELVAEVPEILPVWNLKAVRNTEHPNQGTPTMKSPLRRGYNNARNHVMTRYHITDDAVVPRATGLAVVTVTKPGKRYYAVTAAVDGVESVARFGPGSILAAPVDEKVSKFPAIVFQRSIGKIAKRTSRVDVYNSWIGPPYNNLPTQAETYIMNWYDLPTGSPEKRLPLWVVTGTYGSTAATMGNPGWYNARKHLTGALTVGLAEGGIWRGSHECIGTLKSYSPGRGA